MKIFLVYATLCLIWSSTWIFIKLGLDAGLPPIWFAAVRFALAFAVLMLILAWQKIGLPRSRKVWALAGVSGVLQFFLNYALLFWGEQHISSGLAAVLQATIPGFGLLFAQIHVADERLTWSKAFAVLLGIAGVGAIFYEQLHLSGALAFAGSAAVIGGALCAAYASVLTKAFGNRVESSSLLAAQMLCGLLPLALAAFAIEGNPLFVFEWTWTAISAIFYLALAGSVAAFWMYYWLLKRIAVTKAMMISLVTPIVAVVIGALVLGEKLPPQTFAGAALILLSVAFVLFRRE